MKWKRNFDDSHMDTMIPIPHLSFPIVLLGNVPSRLEDVQLKVQGQRRAASQQPALALCCLWVTVTKLLCASVSSFVKQR